jgi:hypothetical protein
MNNAGDNTSQADNDMAKTKCNTQQGACTKQLQNNARQTKLRRRNLPLPDTVEPTTSTQKTKHILTTQKYKHLLGEKKTAERNVHTTPRG